MHGMCVGTSHRANQSKNASMVEPVPKVWNYGLNYADQEARLQAFDENHRAIFIKTEKGMSVKMNKQTAKPCTCKGNGVVGP